MAESSLDDEVVVDRSEEGIESGEPTGLEGVVEDKSIENEDDVLAGKITLIEEAAEEIVSGEQAGLEEKVDDQPIENEDDVLAGKITSEEVEDTIVSGEQTGFEEKVDDQSIENEDDVLAGKITSAEEVEDKIVLGEQTGLEKEVDDQSIENEDDVLAGKITSAEEVEDTIVSGEQTGLEEKVDDQPIENEDNVLAGKITSAEEAAEKIISGEQTGLEKEVDDQPIEKEDDVLTSKITSGEETVLEENIASGEQKGLEEKSDKYFENKDDVLGEQTTLEAKVVENQSSEENDVRVEKITSEEQTALEEKPVLEQESEIKENIEDPSVEVEDDIPVDKKSSEEHAAIEENPASGEHSELEAITGEEPSFEKDKNILAEGSVSEAESPIEEKITSGEQTGLKETVSDDKSKEEIPIEKIVPEASASVEEPASGKGGEVSEEPSVEQLVLNEQLEDQYLDKEGNISLGKVAVEGESVSVQEDISEEHTSEELSDVNECQPTVLEHNSDVKSQKQSPFENSDLEEKPGAEFVPILEEKGVSGKDTDVCSLENNALNEQIISEDNDILKEDLKLDLIKDKEIGEKTGEVFKKESTVDERKNIVEDVALNGKTISGQKVTEEHAVTKKEKIVDKVVVEEKAASERNSLEQPKGLNQPSATKKDTDSGGNFISDLKEKGFGEQKLTQKEDFGEEVLKENLGVEATDSKQTGHSEKLTASDKGTASEEKASTQVKFTSGETHFREENTAFGEPTSRRENTSCVHVLAERTILEKLTSLLEQLENSVVKQSSLVEELSEEKRRNQKLQDQLNFSQETLKIAEESTDHLKESIGRKSAELVKQYDWSKESRMKLESKVKSLERELDEARSGTQRDKTEVSWKLEREEKRVKELEDMLAEKKEELAEVRRESGRLLLNQSRAEERVQEEARFRTDVEQRNKVLEEEMTKQWTQLKDLMARLTSSESAKQELEAQLEKQTNETRQCYSEIQQVQAETNATTSTLSVVQQRAQAAERKIPELQQQLDEKSLRLQATEAQLRDLTATKIDLRTCKDDINRLKAQLHEERIEKSLLNQQLEDAKQQAAACIDREERFRHENADMKHRLLETQSRLYATEDKSKSVEDMHSLAEQGKKSLFDQVSSLQQEVQRLQTELVQTSQRLDAQINKYDEHKLHHKNKIQQAREIFTRHKTVLADSLMKLQQDLNTTNAELQKEQNNRENLQKKHDSLLEEHRKLLATHSDTEEAVRDQNRNVNTMDYRVKYLERENGVLQNRIDTLSRQRVAMEKLIREYRLEKQKQEIDKSLLVSSSGGVMFPSSPLSTLNSTVPKTTLTSGLGLSQSPSYISTHDLRNTNNGHSLRSSLPGTRTSGYGHSPTNRELLRSPELSNTQSSDES